MESMADEPYTILVVDDEAEQRRLLGGFVQSLGFRAQEASSAEEALEAIHARVPEMVLLDVRLPGMSGIDALAEIRKIAERLPVLKQARGPRLCFGLVLITVLAGVISRRKAFS
jgi:CheY-like chemotaxis protein